MNFSKIEANIIDYFTNKSKQITVNVIFDLENNICSIHLKKENDDILDFVKFQDLNFIFKLLNTEKIDVKDEFYSSGCETCDFGAKSEVKILAYDIVI